MSHDVHVARISKTGAEVAKRNGKHFRSSKIADGEVEYVFGSISPRGGQQPKHLLYEMESPDHIQHDISESDNNISSCSTLDIVNKVEQLSLQQLEMQVRELSHRLKQTEEQRKTLECQLEESNSEREVCKRRLEVVSAAHEYRITEMHCVIAELSKKLRSKDEHIILEEQEPEGSDISYQEGSAFNSEHNLTNPDAECQTEPIDDVDADKDYAQSVQNDFLENLSYDKSPMEAANRAQIEALQEEVLHLKAQIALLQSEIATTLRHDEAPDTTVVETPKIEYYAAELEANESNYSIEEQLCAGHNAADTLNDLNVSPKDFSHSCLPITNPQKSISNVTKMAERVKLRTAANYSVNVKSSDVRQNENTSASLNETTNTENEMQHLQRRIEQYKVRNTLLSLTLDECKEHTEHLYLLCGKYESNAVALQLALNCSDRAIEAYDVMLALLESKLALINEKSTATEDSRKAVEAVARHLLDRLESEKNVCENSLGPWQNNFSIPESVKNNISWSANDDNRLRYHVSKLKGRRATMQNTIVSLESPFSDFYEKKRLSLGDEKETCQENASKSKLCDLETAVLMQELLNLREENILLKTKLDKIERERLHANQRINTLHDALNQLQLQIQITADSNALFHEEQQQQRLKNRASYTEAEHVALTEQQLVEALTRETELKSRIQCLIASVTAIQKMSDEKYEQLHQNVHELQKSNYNLGQMLEQNKRKYQLRIRKLEQKIELLNLNYERPPNGGGVGSTPSKKYENTKRTTKKSTIQQQHQHQHQLQHPQHVPETTL